MTGLNVMGVRTLFLASHEFAISMYTFNPSKRDYGLPRQVAAEVACYLFYADQNPHTGRKPRPPMEDLDAFALRWKTLILRLSTAHDKDEADRAEAEVETCLSPILRMPVRQLRELAPKILALLKADPLVPWLIWRAYEIWVEQMSKAPDEDVKELKTDLAREITDMVEADIAPQLPDALVRALQWRSPEMLTQVKEAIVREKASGNKPRLRGRESCLFLEVGGTESRPEVCIQI